MKVISLLLGLVIAAVATAFVVIFFEPDMSFFVGFENDILLIVSVPKQYLVIAGNLIFTLWALRMSKLSPDKKG